MRFLLKLCGWFFGIGVLGVIVATANQIFGLGMFPNGYPVGKTTEQGQQVGGSYGEFMLVAGVTLAVTCLLGMFLMWRLQRRQERAELLLTALELHEEGKLDLGDLDDD